MPAKRPLSPRRRPQQERGKATVEAILEAATYILVKNGWEALTTNAVAERAGVNISSLYQYFPNKESIVSELRRLHGERISACSSPSKEGTTHEAFATAVSQAVKVYRENAELFRAFEELPRKHRHLVEKGRKVPEALTLPSSAKTSQQSDAELRSFIARTAADAVLREVTLSRPDLLSDARLIDEVSLLLEKYLVRN